MNTNKERKLCWAVIGGGNGGHATAGYLAIKGFPVRLFDVAPDTVKALNKKKGIEVEGCVEGFGEIEFATLDIKKALDGADIVMVVAPALAHKAIAENLAGHLKDGQIVFVHPGSTGGALEFKKIFEDEGCTADVLVCEAMSLIFAARLVETGRVKILGMKEEMMVAAIPSKETAYVLESIRKGFPMMYPGKNVLHTSLENLNPVVHPGPSILNTSMIESGREWKYYWDGITPTIGDFAVQIDTERLAVGKAFGLELKSIMEWYVLEYAAEGENLTEAVRNTKAYEEISGPNRVDTRFLLEDIPMGLFPMVELGSLGNVGTERMDTVISMGGFLLKKNLREDGRTLKRLGIDGMTIGEINRYLETGEK